MPASRSWPVMQWGPRAIWSFTVARGVSNRSATLRRWRGTFDCSSKTEICGGSWETTRAPSSARGASMPPSSGFAPRSRRFRLTENVVHADRLQGLRIARPLQHSEHVGTQDCEDRARIDDSLVEHEAHEQEPGGHPVGRLLLDHPQFVDAEAGL